MLKESCPTDEEDSESGCTIKNNNKNCNNNDDDFLFVYKTSGTGKRYMKMKVISNISKRIHFNGIADQSNEMSYLNRRCA